MATKPIIVDGGIREHSDIAKSIRFDATMVMIGSMLAGHEESPGKTVELRGTKLMDVRKVNYVILGGDNAGEQC